MCFLRYANKMESSVSTENKHIYRIIFQNQGKVYELFAKSICQSSMYGFIEVEKILFGERSQVLLDPSEEKLKSEFSGVKRTYIPQQSIVRIDEVNKAGTNKIVALTESQNISNFPYSGPLDISK